MPTLTVLWEGIETGQNLVAEVLAAAVGRALPRSRVLSGVRLR